MRSGRSWQMQVFTFLSVLWLALSVQAKPDAQVIEMNGEALSEKESLDLIYFRTDYDMLVDIQEIRWNGKLMDSIDIEPDRYLTVMADVGQVEEVRNGRNRKVRRAKMKKIGLVCTDKIVSVQGDFHLNPHVVLFRGSSVIFKMDDEPLRKSGNLIKLFVCPPKAESQKSFGPREHLPPPPPWSRRSGVQ